MKSVLLILFFSFYGLGYCQETEKSQDQFRIMFYNVENLFDPFDDSLKNDEEFVAGGSYGWTWKKFDRKLKDLSKVIVAAGGWTPPEIVAFCEIENRFVLIQLLKRTSLDRFGYKIVHTESPDVRGIDVGLIYLKDRFKELSHRAILIKSAEHDFKTRNILYVKGLVMNAETGKAVDTLHVFVNHWPSRSGGQAASAWRRKAAAQSLKTVVDSILDVTPNAKIVLTGDFNDEPTDESVSEVLGAKKKSPGSSGKLFNLMTSSFGKNSTGTHKYRNNWSVIDQFIVSAQLLVVNSKLSVNNSQIITFPFLLESDEKYGGLKPKRTFVGRKYNGGYSDHLPILLTIEINHKSTSFK